EAGDPSKRKPYLPANKQFLVTRNVPCLRRAISVEEEYDAAGAEVVLDEDGEGWLATHGVQASKPEEEEDIPSMDTLDIGRSDGIKSIPSYFSGGKDEEEEDIPDMDTYEDTGDICIASNDKYSAKPDTLTSPLPLQPTIKIWPCCVVQGKIHPHYSRGRITQHPAAVAIH
ncbi:hypothetical protein ACJX0J_005586, partial [Zea mays]